MKYDGFISTIIDRSEQLLPVDASEDLQVTRMLLLLNTGFALVWDRMQYWEDHDDARLRKLNPWSAFKKARERKFATPVTLQRAVSANRVGVGVWRGCEQQPERIEV